VNEHSFILNHSPQDGKKFRGVAEKRTSEPVKCLSGQASLWVSGRPGLVAVKNAGLCRDAALDEKWLVAMIVQSRRCAHVRCFPVQVKS